MTIKHVCDSCGATEDIWNRLIDGMAPILDGHEFRLRGQVVFSPSASGKDLCISCALDWLRGSRVGGSEEVGGLPISAPIDMAPYRTWGAPAGVDKGDEPEDVLDRRIDFFLEQIAKVQDTGRSPRRIDVEWCGKYGRPRVHVGGKWISYMGPFMLKCDLARWLGAFESGLQWFGPFSFRYEGGKR